jgi:hypothetical protein
MRNKSGKGGDFHQNDLYRLKREVEQLRSIVMHMLHGQASGLPIDLNLKAIREALYLGQEGDVSEVLERLGRTGATVQGKTPCPKCQSMVEVREGIQPKCSFCGAQFDAQSTTAAAKTIEEA